jgi:ABC-type transport system involved in multi-copper enzyme maturation permease subunit
MPFEHKIVDYWTWLVGDPTTWRLLQPETWGFLSGLVAILLMLAFVVPFIWFLFASIQMGPGEAFYLVARTVYGAFSDDLPRFSLRRTLAVARLCIQEAIRNRVLVVAIGVFVVLMLFAGLFLDVDNRNPARVYLSFVLTTTNYLVLLMVLFLSTFSLPADIKNRTIYTVVTKPIRPSEIVLGRILGFGTIGTVMIVAMGVVSYLFVVRGLAHDHEIVAADLTDIPPPSPDVPSPGRRGETSLDMYHRHTVEIDNEGNGKTNTVAGHWHDVTVTGEGENQKITLSPPRGMLIARAPIYGKLRILDRQGNLSEKGINVGYEWEYRGYIEGGNTRAAAIWTFDGITPEKYPDGLPLELNLRVFRSYKGNIERGVLGEIIVRNPNPQAAVKSSGPIPFESKEFMSDFRMIPRELYSEAGGSGSGGKIDLFDLVDNGKIEIVVRCAEPGQYFGMAEPDVYLRPSDASFELNFAKAYLGIWLQMMMVTCFGVMFSTFLSWPVAVMSTVSVIVLGFFGQFARDVATGVMEGGGPIESFIRMLTQANVQTDMEMHWLLVNIIKGLDGALMYFMYAATYVLPDFRKFDTSRFVTDGYNIYGDIVAQQLTLGIVFFVVVALVGYFLLKTREIAA